MSTNNATFTMKMGKGYVIFDAICVFIFVIFFLLSAYYGVTSGVLLFFFCIIGAVFNFFDRKARKIIVDNGTIIDKGMLKRQKRIDFEQVEYLTLEKRNNTDVICIISNTDLVIKIPKFYQNVERFEEMIVKQHWHWR